MSKNLFIVFEGIDGSGKTMQTEKLYFNIKRQLNQEVHYTKEPTVGPIGVFIKEHFLSGKTQISEEALMYLFTADRIEHLYTGDSSLTKMLEESHVICDRYMLSSLAYNSFAYQSEAVKQMAFGQTHRIPDITFFMDIPIDVAIERIKQRKGPREIFDNVDKLHEVYDRYQNIIHEYPNHNIKVIDANRDPNIVAEDIFITLCKHIDGIE